MTDYLDENYFEDKILQMLHYDTVDLNKGIDLSNSKECMIYPYWLFNHGFKFQDSICSGFHNVKY